MSTPLRPRLRDLPRTAVAAPAAAVAAVLLLCAACNYGEVVVVEPAAAHGPLALLLLADPEDSAAARQLGWTTGIPGAEVTVSPANADTAAGPPVATLQTDNAGRASVADLADGHYLVEVRRLLTAAEIARLAPTEDVVGLMAQTIVARGSVTVPPRQPAPRSDGRKILQHTRSGITDFYLAPRTPWELP